MNATSLEAEVAARAQARRLSDRALLAIPVAGVALALLTLYAVEAWLRKTPWVFTDELEWAQISRAIEETGHAARRGEPIGFKSLYAVLIAPFWAIDSTARAYAAIKYANVVIMTAAAIPTYLLARMYVSRRRAFAVAVLAVCIPGMAYVTSIVPEVLAYPWYALCSWLIVRALATRTRLAIALAVAASGIALAVRAPQFATVPASFVIAAALLWLTGERGRRFRAGWSVWDTVGALVLLVGALMLFNRVVLQHVEIWQVSTQYWKERMFTLGLRAVLAFSVGMAILPVLGGIAALRLTERRHDPVYRAFAAYLGATIVCVTLYTAVKAAYLSTVFATLTEERNMIYLAPLMLIGTAMTLEARRVDWRIVGAASALVLALVLWSEMDVQYPYYEAPGFGILAVMNRNLHWDYTDLTIGLVVTLAVALAVLALRRFPAAVAASAVVVLAWMLTCQIGTSAGTIDLADRFRKNLPEQLDWVDRATGGAPVTYLGQAIHDPNGLWLTEFWNRSLVHVASLDGTAPGPGPTRSPTLVDVDGTLENTYDTHYVLTDNGVTLQGPVVARWKQLTLYRIDGPWKLLEALQQVYADGWAPGWSSYSYFAPGEHGHLEIVLSRTGYKGDAPPGHARVVVGDVAVGPDGDIQLGENRTVRRAIVRNGESQKLVIPVKRTPVRVEIRISPTFRAGPVDPRQVGAQVAFRFVKDR